MNSTFLSAHQKPLDVQREPGSFLSGSSNQQDKRRTAAASGLFGMPALKTQRAPEALESLRGLDETKDSCESAGTEKQSPSTYAQILSMAALK